MDSWSSWSGCALLNHDGKPNIPSSPVVIDDMKKPITISNEKVIAYASEPKTYILWPMQQEWQTFDHLILYFRALRKVENLDTQMQLHWEEDHGEFNDDNGAK